MILKRGNLTLEFFHHPELDPLTSWFSCCLRLDDLDSFYAICKPAGLPEGCKRQPRLHPPRVESWGGRIGAAMRAGRLRKEDERGARLFRRYTEAIPRRQWNTHGVLWEHIAHIEDNGSEASSLKK